MIIKELKKLEESRRQHTVGVRFSATDFKKLMTKASEYTKGNRSFWLRHSLFKLPPVQDMDTAVYLRDEVMTMVTIKVSTGELEKLRRLARKHCGGVLSTFIRNQSIKSVPTPSQLA
jgi:hypothetical protein